MASQSRFPPSELGLNLVGNHSLSHSGAGPVESSTPQATSPVALVSEPMQQATTSDNELSSPTSPMSPITPSIFASNAAHQLLSSKKSDKINDAVSFSSLPLHELREIVASQQKMIGELRETEQSLQKQLKDRDNQWRQTMAASMNKKEAQISQLRQEKNQLESQVRKEKTKAAELSQKVTRFTKATKSKGTFQKKALPTLPPGKKPAHGASKENSRGRSQTAATPMRPKVTPSRSRLQHAEPPKVIKVSPSRSKLTKKTVTNKCNNSASPKMGKDGVKKEQKAKTPNKTTVTTQKKPNASDGIETVTKSKEERKNALGALFASRNGAKKSSKDSNPVLSDGKGSSDSSDGGVDSGSVSKKDTANALGALFAARKSPKPTSSNTGSGSSTRNRSFTVPVVSAPQKAKEKTESPPNPKLAKYYKMKKIGMPMVSCINKMRMDGCSAELIAEFKGEKIEKPAATTVDLNDPKFKKYKMMKKIQQPMESIINRMRMDGMSQHDIDAFSGKKSNSSTAGTAKVCQDTKRKELAIAMGLKPKSARIPQKVEKLKRIHWKVIPIKDIIRARKPRLPAHTSRRQLGGLASIMNPKPKEKKERVTWIGGKRDQNIQIGLKTIGLSVDKICDGFLAMDDAVITLDRLETLLDLTPTPEEQEKAEERSKSLGADDHLGPSELFHVELSVVPEVRKQVTKWLFCKTFKEIYMDRLQQTNKMVQALSFCNLHSK